MSLIGNILWLLGGGLLMAVGWWLYGVLLFCTVIGIPWARSCFVIGNLALWPFGREVVYRRDVTGRDDPGTGTLGLVGNTIWIVVAGFWLAVGHVLAAALWTITILGIPFAIQHMKLARLAVAPVGMTVVDSEFASTARRSHFE